MGQKFTRDEAKSAVMAQVEDLEPADQIKALEEVIEDMKSEHSRKALYPPQMTSTVEEGKATLVLDNGVRIVCCGNDTLQAGEDVHVYNKLGDEIGFWTSDEWRDDPVLVMGAIVLCACSGKSADQIRQGELELDVGELEKKKDHYERVLCVISETLWPGGDAEHDWDSDTMGELAEALHAVGFGPQKAESDEEDPIVGRLRERYSMVDLDEHVHELKACEAKSINNSSFEEQVAYLREQAGDDWIEEVLLDEG